MTGAEAGWLPFGFPDWHPWAQAATLGLLTFVQEDVPTVGSALLAAGGRLSWSTGFLGVFAGIWIGDALLYLLARGLGRPLLARGWARRWVDPAAVARSERWFAEKGTWLLIASRFVPGTRLPTYLAAGFLRLPFTRFLLVTGAAVGAWTIGIFLLARFVGPGLTRWLEGWNAGGWTVLGAVVLLLLVWRLGLKALCPALDPGAAGATDESAVPANVPASSRDGRRRRDRWRNAWGHWRHWEFWPAWLFYIPVVLNCLRLAMKYRGFTLPTAANPGIFSGGLVGESKLATLQELHATSPEFTAEAHGLAPGSLAARRAALEEICRRHHIDYPFVLKPDVGQRGAGVKLIRTPEQAGEYLRQVSAPLVIQRYAPGPCEVGVFYYRFPDEPRGRLFAITEKVFPTVTGDGVRTLEALVLDDPRARWVADTYRRRFGERCAWVPAAGEVVRLVEAGNHAQGCIFRDGSHLWSEALERRIDAISQGLDGFFIGRYDIRYASEPDLREGRELQILELNGAASEATSIYDARNSLRDAYRTLFRQWELVFAIGAANRRRGTVPMRPLALWRASRQAGALVATYPPAD